MLPPLWPNGREHREVSTGVVATWICVHVCGYVCVCVWVGRIGMWVWVGKLPWKSFFVGSSERTVLAHWSYQHGLPPEQLISSVCFQIRPCVRQNPAKPAGRYGDGPDKIRSPVTLQISWVKQRRRGQGGHEFKLHCWLGCWKMLDCMTLGGQHLALERLQPL